MKILRTKEYNKLVAKLAMYKELLKVERLINNKLESKIDKMKCCGNCKHIFINDNWPLYCDEDNVINFNSLFCDKWELKSSSSENPNN